MKGSFALSLLLLILLSCGKIKPKGELATKDVPVKDFSAIDLKGKFRVFFIKNPKNFVTVETYPNIAENLDIKSDGKVLSIKEKKQTKGVDFYNLTIYSKFFPSEISAADSVEFNVSGSINTDQIKLNLKDNCKFIGAVKTRRTQLNMQGLSRANLTGFSKNAQISARDTIGLIAPYWEIGNLKLDCKNGSYVEVNVQDSLTGSISDTGKMLYYNDPIRAFKIGKSTDVQNKPLQ